MARELVFGCGWDPITVGAMTSDQVRYWYNAALERQKKRDSRQ